MKNPDISHLFLFLFLLVTLTGCDIALDIFEAGLWIGVIIVILVIALVVWLVKKFLR